MLGLGCWQRLRVGIRVSVTVLGGMEGSTTSDRIGIGGLHKRGVNLSFASISECANRSYWIRQYKHWRSAQAKKAQSLKRSLKVLKKKKGSRSHGLMVSRSEGSGRGGTNL